MGVVGNGRVMGVLEECGREEMGGGREGARIHVALSFSFSSANGDPSVLTTLDFRLVRDISQGRE